MLCLPQFRRSQVRDRSHRNRCFGLRFGGMHVPNLRGVMAASMTGDGPVEVASDWVDADSADEVRVCAMRPKAGELLLSAGILLIFYTAALA